MLLKNLIKDIPKNKNKIIVSGLSSNSKNVKKNYIFFAIKGNKYNGEKFIKDAVKKGASVIVCSKKCKFNHKKILVVKRHDIRNFLSEVCSKFYKLKPKNMVAVTGTNGKTSVSDLFHQIFNLNKIPVASVGTLGIKYKNKIIKTNLTSPDTITLHKYLNFLKKRRIDNVIIEASSHGLDQNRLHHLNFKGAVFTNLSQDHLDYHKSMNSYLNAKLILFKKILKKNSIIISDKEIQPFKQLREIARKRKINILDVSKEIEKIKKNYSKIFVDYRIKNLAMAILSAKICGLKEKLIYQKIKKLKDVSGRLELVASYKNNIKIFLDYAHTPDALSKTLKSLKERYGNNISLVFGCGGNRDKKKRPFMARIANEICKKIYVTDDNPREEQPHKIRNDLVKFIDKKKVHNIGDRAKAIKKAIKNAGANEILLIAGKGHEETQIYKNKLKIFSDKKIVKRFKFKTKLLSKNEQEHLQNRSILQKIFGKNKLPNFNGISIDTRTLKKNNLFLAIKGRKYDGNNFVKTALRRGAALAVTPSFKGGNKDKIKNIKNPKTFLNIFAKLKRECSNAKIIAITGSAGKTSLKNLIRELLQNLGKTHSSPKSFNNHFGVPLSISNLNFDDKFGIFEVGMSKAGEIRNLSKLIKPHIGIITNIGEAHLENFKNIFGIAKAKSEIIENIERNGTIILNRDDKFFSYLYKKSKLYKLKIITFGKHKKSDIRLKKIRKKGNYYQSTINVDKESIIFETKDLNIYNILAAITVLKELEFNLHENKFRFKNLEAPEGRGKRHLISRYKKKFRLIDESYNANPLSVKNAINKLNLIKKDNFKKYLILGDMLELGSNSQKYHEQISKVINSSDIDKVFIKGKKTIFTYKYLNKEKRGNILQNIEDIDFSLSKIISNNDYLMIKGSNATGLYDFSKKIIKGF